MTQVIATTYKFTHAYREKIFAILVASIFLTAFAYIFLLQKTIVNVVERQRMTVESRQLSIRLADLEQKYFSLKNNVTFDLARSKGFSSADVVSYISKKPRTAMAAHHDL